MMNGLLVPNYLTWTFISQYTGYCLNSILPHVYFLNQQLPYKLDNNQDTEYKKYFSLSTLNSTLRFFDNKYYQTIEQKQIIIDPHTSIIEKIIHTIKRQAIIAHDCHKRLHQIVINGP
jgi:hypothetical protein